MENLLESNERTLDIFDAVYSGLAECSALVHADIRQMSEHREQLARQLELDDEQNAAAQRFTSTLARHNYTQTDLNCDSDSEGDLKREQASERDVKATSATASAFTSSTTKTNSSEPLDLADLRLLDKQLADSFSQALSRYDRDDFKPAAGSQSNRASSQKPSLFQVLLGRGGGGGGTNTKRQNIISEKRGAKPLGAAREEPFDARSIIDDINRQTRLALQYSKQLEAHLLKVEDLRAKYEMHLKMGLAVRSVSRAYLGNSTQTSSSSLGLSQRSHRQQLTSSLVLAGQPVYNGLGASNGPALHKSVSHSSLKRSGRSGTSANYSHHQMHKSPLGLSQQHLASSTTSADSKNTIRQFIENIERLEAEFESYMGSFLLNIEDIQGFARICQGDVFKIEIRHGATQKFKTRISVLKDNRQKCDQRQTVFKARIADVLVIKAYECKGLGKRVLLGHKLCETRDLFTARSQLMTISLNQTGSIKLNLMVTWNPLHLAPKASPAVDVAHFSPPPTPISSSTLSSLSSARSTRSISSCDTKFNGPLGMEQRQHHHHHHQQQQQQRSARVKSAIISRPHHEHLASLIEPQLRVGQLSPKFSDTSGSDRQPKGECCADCDLNSPHLFVYGHHIPEPDYLTASLESKF